MVLDGFTRGEWITLEAERIKAVDQMEGGSMSMRYARELAEDEFTARFRAKVAEENRLDGGSFSDAFEDFCSSFE